MKQLYENRICQNCDHKLPIGRDKYCSPLCEEENEGWVVKKKRLEKERNKNLIEKKQIVICSICNQYYNKGKKHWCYSCWSIEDHRVKERSVCHCCWDRLLNDAISKNGL
jgi:hypothetical protein